MRPRTTKYKLWQLMLAIAALGGMFAWLDVVGTGGMLAAAAVSFLPIVFAGAGHRLRAAAWVCSLYPLFFLASIYLSWLVAWSVLGHEPGLSIDDRKDVVPFVNAPVIATVVFAMGLPFALFLVGPLMLAHDIQSFRAEGLQPFKMTARLVIPVLVWFSVGAILWLRILGVGTILDWYID